MEGKAKGTVTSLSSLFTAEEAESAAERVEEKIQEKYGEINRLRHFIADNSDLINLVKRLPHQLHHDIMVPFGEAAFFPGRLIHTNEFLTLLGENYYVERTSNQTVEILNRRGKNLETQVDFLKANVNDLKVEASFFASTASEVAEGIVDIREDYVDESSAQVTSTSGVGGEELTPEVNDEEYQRMMARLDELEMEELAAERGENGDEDQPVCKGGKSGFTQSTDKNDINQEEHEAPSAILDEGKPLSPSQQIFKGNAVIQVLPDKYQNPVLPGDVLQDSKSMGQKFQKDKTSSFGSLQRDVHIPSLPVEVTERTTKRETGPSRGPEAFTGLIVERSPDFQTKRQKSGTTASQATSSQSSKPVSRFKMRKEGRQ